MPVGNFSLSLALGCLLTQCAFALGSQLDCARCTSAVYLLVWPHLWGSSLQPRDLCNVDSNAGKGNIRKVTSKLLATKNSHRVHSEQKAQCPSQSAFLLRLCVLFELCPIARTFQEKKQVVEERQRTDN